MDDMVAKPIEIARLFQVLQAMLSGETESASPTPADQSRAS